jgi:hypothetical protein
MTVYREWMQNLVGPSTPVSQLVAQRNLINLITKTLWFLQPPNLRVWVSTAVSVSTWVRRMLTDACDRPKACDSSHVVCTRYVAYYPPS